MEDKEIIDMYFARDENAVKETQKKYERLLCGVARNILKDEGEVQECMNDVLFGAWNNIPPARPDNLCAYLAKSIRYISLGKMDYQKAKKRQAEIVEISEELEHSMVSCHLQDDLEGRELAKLISVFLRKCKYEQRVIFVRRYWYGSSVEEIAELLNISQGKVKSVLFRVRNKLKEFLESEGVYL